MQENTSLVLVGSRTVITTGNSQGVTIPEDILDHMGVDVGDEVALVYDRDERTLAVEDDERSLLGE